MAEKSYAHPPKGDDTAPVKEPMKGLDDPIKPILLIVAGVGEVIGGHKPSNADKGVIKVSATVNF